MTRPRRTSPSSSILTLLLLAPVLATGAMAWGARDAAAAEPCNFNLDACPDTTNPARLFMHYSGQSCSATHHTQDSASVACSGDPLNANPVRVLVTDRPDPTDAAARVWFNGTVPIGGDFVVEAETGGAARFGNLTYAYVYSGALEVQRVRFSTSCSVPLKEGDQFGSLSIQRPRFPRIPIWGVPGAFQDSSTVAGPPNDPHRYARRCIGSFKGPRLSPLTNLPDTIRQQPRTLSVRFLRDRVAEARNDFGGYRIYRVQNSVDTTRAVLIRRYSRQLGDERTWQFSVVNDTTLQYMCNGAVMNDSIVTFVDPDSNGNWVKVCRTVDHLGRCTSRGDSIFVLQAPPGPHDGFRTWYAITYEQSNRGLPSPGGDYQDLFVPDTLGIIGPCGVPGDTTTCPNLNNKCYNMVEAPVAATRGPTANLEKVGVVPNPYRAHESWDRAGGNELHFINLPAKAKIRVYTAAGDLVVELLHDDTVRDFAVWNLKNQSGQDVASGIYMFRVESDLFSFQDRFIVIR
jgi:hypothetical protein